MKIMDSKQPTVYCSKYQMINQILSARKLDKSEEVKKGLKKYLRQEQYVKEMFVITEED